MKKKKRNKKERCKYFLNKEEIRIKKESGKKKEEKNEEMKIRKLKER